MKVVFFSLQELCKTEVIRSFSDTRQMQWGANDGPRVQCDAADAETDAVEDRACARRALEGARRETVCGAGQSQTG